MTALEEQRGGALDVTITAGNSPYLAQLDSGPNRARLYVVRPDAGGRVFRLPDATRCSIGCKPSVTVVNLGSFAIDVQTRAGVLVQAVGVSQAAEFYALPGGTWRNLTSGLTCAESAALNALRLPFVLDYTANRATPTNFRVDLAKQYGYTSSQGPVALIVRVASDVVLGGGTTTRASVTTGTWPAGSTCYIDMAAGSYFAGGGGAGGNGMLTNGTGMTAGAQGGHGLDVYIPTVIVGRTAGGLVATIAGGGGGGGGGARRATGGFQYFGGAGGGGAGAPGGAGGPAISGNLSSAGQPGGLVSGGPGGVPDAIAAKGGAGGALGFAGSAGEASNVAGVGLGAAGGVAGNSTRRLPSVSLTILGSVTLLGTQVTL